MPRYSFSVSERYGDDDAPATLDRIVGAPIGLSRDDWPRHRGRPMQHAFTVDLAHIEIDVPRAREARALSVFVDTYYELDPGGGEAIRVVWLTQAQIDRHPETQEPPDFIAELRPGHEQRDEDGDYHEAAEPKLDITALDEEDAEPSFGDSYVGGAPVWAESGPPEQLPGGRFVMQVMSYEFALGRRSACLFVFEDGAYLQAEDAEDEYRPVPWAEAIAASRELALGGAAPIDALQKYGGLPRGITAADWPKRMTHIMTWVPDPPIEDEDTVALALFGRLTKTDNWDVGPATFFELREIRRSDLDGFDAAAVELPEGAEWLPELELVLRPLPDGATWRDLQTRSFVGPRPAWPHPDHRSVDESHSGPVLQLNQTLLPVTPGHGSLILTPSSQPIWHPQPGTPQAERNRYVPEGTLYARYTTAAIVVGWELGFADFSASPEKIEVLERTLISAAAIRVPDHGLSLIVPGDTTTDPNGEVHGSVVFGRVVIAVEANDPEPGRVDLAEVQAAVESLPDFEDAFWREALLFATGIEGPLSQSAYLLAWGPLCYAAILVGVESGKDDAPRHRFVANQDMHQEWSTRGIDGVSIESVEFSSVAEILWGDEQLAKADKVDGAGFWLICRYD